MDENRAKKIRSNCLSNFTRSANTFDALYNDEAPIDILTGAFEKVQSCWEKLEAAQDSFIELTAIDVDTDAMGIAYLNAPDTRQFWPFLWLSREEGLRK